MFGDAVDFPAKLMFLVSRLVVIVTPGFPLPSLGLVFHWDPDCSPVSYFATCVACHFLQDNSNSTKCLFTSSTVKLHFFASCWHVLMKMSVVSISFCWYLLSSSLQTQCLVASLSCSMRQRLFFVSPCRPSSPVARRIDVNFSSCFVALIVKYSSIHCQNNLNDSAMSGKHHSRVGTCIDTVAMISTC